MKILTTHSRFTESTMVTSLVLKNPRDPSAPLVYLPPAAIALIKTDLNLPENTAARLAALETIVAEHAALLAAAGLTNPPA